MNSYSYARDNPVTLSDPNGKILPIILGALAVYSAAQLSIDTYDVYQTDFKYANVFSPEEKSATNFKLGYDLALTAVGGSAARVGLETAGRALGALSATGDALDTYFGPQIYKTYNDEHSPNKKKDDGVNVSVSSVSVGGSGTSRTNTSSSNTSYTSHQTNVQYSSPSQGSGGSSYSQLVSSLSRLVSSLSAYVSGLSGSKSN